MSNKLNSSWKITESFFSHFLCVFCRHVKLLLDFWITPRIDHVVSYVLCVSFQLGEITFFTYFFIYVWQLSRTYVPESPASSDDSPFTSRGLWNCLDNDVAVRLNFQDVMCRCQYDASSSWWSSQSGYYSCQEFSSPIKLGICQRPRGHDFFHASCLIVSCPTLFEWHLTLCLHRKVELLDFLFLKCAKWRKLKFVFATYVVLSS